MILEVIVFWNRGKKKIQPHGPSKLCWTQHPNHVLTMLRKQRSRTGRVRNLRRKVLSQPVGLTDPEAEDGRWFEGFIITNGTSEDAGV